VNSAGLFPVKLSDILGDFFTVRNKCDYDDFYVLSKEEVARQFEMAGFFTDTIRQYLNEKVD